MNYKHLSQIERYQIHSLMKAQHKITQFGQLLGRNKSMSKRAGQCAVAAPMEPRADRRQAAVSHESLYLHVYALRA